MPIEIWLCCSKVPSVCHPFNECPWQWTHQAQDQINLSNSFLSLRSNFENSSTHSTEANPLLSCAAFSLLLFLLHSCNAFVAFFLVLALTVFFLLVDVFAVAFFLISMAFFVAFISLWVPLSVSLPRQQAWMQSAHSLVEKELVWQWWWWWWRPMTLANDTAWFWDIHLASPEKVQLAKIHLTMPVFHQVKLHRQKH